MDPHETIRRAQAAQRGVYDLTGQYMSIPVSEFEALHERIRELESMRQAISDGVANHVAELQLEVQRLTADNLELQDECDQWERKLEQAWIELIDLRAQVKEG